MAEKAYIIEQRLRKMRQYNPKYGDSRLCQCGHIYYRHFDSYDEMAPCGCKYCSCDTFVQRVKEYKEPKKKWIVYVYDIVEQEEFEDEGGAEMFAEGRHRIHQQMTRIEEVECDDE